MNRTGGLKPPAVFQNDGLTQLESYITNNDNAIYNSATFNLVGTYGNLGWVLEALGAARCEVGVSGGEVVLSHEWREPLVPGGRRFYRLVVK